MSSWGLARRLPVRDGHEHILARLHLKAVLPAIAALVQGDDWARSLMEGQRFGVQLTTRSGISTRLDFLDGDVQVDSSNPGRQPLELLFLTDRQLNRTFKGNGFSLPIPVRGFSGLARLRTFAKLTARLDRVLTASPRRLMDENLQGIHVDLLIGTLIPSAIAELVHCDPLCKGWLAPYADTLVAFKVDDSASSWIRFENKRAVFSSGTHGERADVIISFRSRDVAVSAIRGELDTLGALGKGQMTVRGLIPLAEALDRVLERMNSLLNTGR